MKKLKARSYAGFFLLTLFFCSYTWAKESVIEYRRNYLYHLSLVLPKHYLTETSLNFKRMTGQVQGEEAALNAFELTEEIKTGVTDRVELNFNWAYLISENLKTSSYNVKSSGPREFSLGFKYRWLTFDEEKNYNFDLIFTLKPDLANNILATPSNNGNGMAGQTVWEVEGVLGKREERSEFSIHGTLAYLGRQTVVNQDLGLRFRSNLSYLAKIFFIMQPRLKMGHYLKALVGARKRGDRKIFNLHEREDVSFFGEVSYTYKLTPQIALGLSFNWLERNGKEISSGRDLAINEHVFVSSFNLTYLIF